MIVWTFKDILFICFISLIFTIFICFILFEIFKHVMHKLFYKNCINCKHCKLTNVASCGDGADYSCTLTIPYVRLNNRMIKYNENIWRRCKNFEK